MKGNQYGLLFRFIRGILRIVYPKYKIQLHTTTHTPVVYVSHHQNLFGPFVTMLWFPSYLHPWILHLLLDQRACYNHYVDYTFTNRFSLNKNLAKMLALPISYFISKFLKSAKGIPVYRGSRKIVSTFQQSVTSLCKGENIVIFPDIDYSDTSSRTKSMYEGFLHLEKYYHRATGKHLCFVPLYVSKNKRMIVAEKEIYFSDGEDFQEGRDRVYQKILTSLNELAEMCGDD